MSFYIKNISESEARDFSQIKNDYFIEKRLAGKLRNGSREERKNLYAETYENLFNLLPMHPQTIKKELGVNANIVLENTLFYKYMSNETVFLEVGAGDCTLSFRVSERVRFVYAVDVSEYITHHENQPDNFKLIISDGTSIPIAEESISLAYSNQLLEHLHPEDAIEHLENICKCLKPGGAYVCHTPNRLYGPRDISRFFDNEATGLHLKEYTNFELKDAFVASGFHKVHVFTRLGSHYVRLPLFLVTLVENLLLSLPVKIQKKISRSPFRRILGINIVAFK